MKLLKVIFTLALFYVLCVTFLYFVKSSNFKKHSLVYSDYSDFFKNKSFIYVEGLLPKDAYDILIFSGVDPSFYSLEFRYKGDLQWHEKKSWKLVRDKKTILKKYFKSRLWRNNNFRNVELYKSSSSKGVVQFVLIDEINKYVWFSDGNFL